MRLLIWWCIWLTTITLGLSKTHYETLGVRKTATADEIKKRYRELAKTTHPDKTKNTDSADEFIKISEAYEVLSDPQKKRQYDLSLQSDDSPRYRQSRSHRRHQGFHDFQDQMRQFHQFNQEEPIYYRYGDNIYVYRTHTSFGQGTSSSVWTWIWVFLKLIGIMLQFIPQFLFLWLFFKIFYGRPR